MVERLSHRPVWITGLSARLLVLTAIFVMVSEVLIYVPSISRFRNVALADHIARAHIAILALEATPDAMVSNRLERDLLFHAGAYSVVLTEPGRRMLMLGESGPPLIDASFDLRESTVADMIMETFVSLAQTENRILQVIGRSPRVPDATLEVVIDERPIREAMIDYSVRILTLSIVISLLTAGLVYLALHWLMVRPMLVISDRMMRFGENPEDDRATVPATARKDEIGIVMRELAAMQRDLRTALHQKTRLAALGAAMAKINHDLRNTLATAVLASDRLAGIDQPEVKRLMPQLYNAVARAADLCGRTLDFVRSERPLLHASVFVLRDLIDEVAASVVRSRAEEADAPTIESSGADVRLEADREQMFRALSNLILNALQAGASRVNIAVGGERGALKMDIRDDGHGIPPGVQQHLFQPFAGFAERRLRAWAGNRPGDRCRSRRDS